MQSVLDRPMTGEQLRDVDVCPRHNVRLLIEEYGNTDSAMLCPQCEDEIEAERLQDLYDEQLAEVDQEPVVDTDNEFYYSQEYIDKGGM